MTLPVGVGCMGGGAPHLAGRGRAARSAQLSGTFPSFINKAKRVHTAFTECRYHAHSTKQMMSDSSQEVIRCST